MAANLPLAEQVRNGSRSTDAQWRARWRTVHEHRSAVKRAGLGQPALQFALDRRSLQLCPDSLVCFVAWRKTNESVSGFALSPWLVEQVRTGSQAGLAARLAGFRPGQALPSITDAPAPRAIALGAPGLFMLRWLQTTLRAGGVVAIAQGREERRSKSELAEEQPAEEPRR